jgi:hypothetical protein
MACNPMCLFCTLVYLLLQRQNHHIHATIVPTTVYYIHMPYVFMYSIQYSEVFWGCSLVTRNPRWPPPAGRGGWLLSPFRPWQVVFWGRITYQNIANVLLRPVSWHLFIWPLSLHPWQRWFCILYLCHNFHVRVQSRARILVPPYLCCPWPRVTTTSLL